MCATRIAYYNMKNYIIVVIGVLGCISCNNSTPSNSYMPSQGYKEESADYADDSESLQQVLCPMCGGTGVFDFMSGDVMAPKQTCTGCGGNGIVGGNQHGAACCLADGICGIGRELEVSHLVESRHCQYDMPGGCLVDAVSYSPLTLPTKRRGIMLAGALSL